MGQHPTDTPTLQPKEGSSNIAPPNKTEWPEEFITGHYRMISASGEAEALRYYYVLVGNQYYMYSNQVNAGDNVYVGRNYPHGSDGFGGRTLSFPLVDGILGPNGETVIKLCGPWATHSAHFLKACGVDLTNRHYTQVVVSTYREMMKETMYDMRHRFTGLLHYEPEMVLGRYTRYKAIAHECAKEHGDDVFYHMDSGGGSTTAKTQVF